MEYNNKLIEMAKKEGGIDKETCNDLACFWPHLHHISAEEIWEQLGGQTAYSMPDGRTAMREAMKDDEIEVPVQINGKTRAVIIPADISKEDAIAAGKEAVADKLTGTIVKEIYVPKKIVNLVVK